MVSLQWFIDVDKKIPGREKSLKEASIEVVKSGQIEIMPDRFKKIYFHWMENLHDWCISRQIWFGHRIPAYYCECGQVVVSLTPPSSCWKCGKNNFQQDPDTLDTWFSSGLWTFSTLGWPEETDDIKIYHPTSLMETGYDILFFWVARMILMSEYALGDIPFKKVYLHGLIKDKEGRKMSKSLDNGIDPIEMIEKFGADALRLSMLIGTTAGNDFKLYEEKIASFRNFVNKLWNVSRFIMSNCKKMPNGPWNSPPPFPNDYSLSDRWILSELDATIKSVTDSLESYKLSKAGETLYDFTWNKLADWYLEVSKIEPNYKPFILNYILETILKLWHPLMPFVTETIWKEMGHDNLLMIADWPTEISTKMFRATPEMSISIYKQFSTLQKIITSVRNIRAEYKIEPTEKMDIVLETSQTGAFLGIEHQVKIIEKLSKTSVARMPIMERVEPLKVTTLVPVIINSETKVIIAIDINVKQEKGKATKELSELESYIKTLEQELSNEKFLVNAPKEIVKQKEKKLAEIQNKIEKIKKQVALFS